MKKKTNNTKKVKTMYYKDGKPTSIMQMFKRRIIYLIDDKGYNQEQAIVHTFYTFIEDIVTHPYYTSRGYSMDEIKRRFIQNLTMSFIKSKKFGTISHRKQGGFAKK